MNLIFFLLISNIFLKEIRIDEEKKANFLDLLREKPKDIKFYIITDSLLKNDDSSKIYLYSYYKNYIKILEIPYENFKKRIEAKVTSTFIFENKRVEYLIGQGLLGISLYSWSLPIFLELEDVPAVGIGGTFPLFYLGITALSTSGQNISSSQAYGSFMGGVMGGIHGGLISQNKRGIFPGGIFENYLDFFLCRSLRIPLGVYQRKFNHTLYGYYHYFTFKSFLEKEYKIEKKDYLYSSILSILEGYGSLFISKNEKNLTFGDALFELRLGIIGAEAFPAMLLTYDNISKGKIPEELYAFSSLLGHFGGYYLGDKLSKKYDISFSTAIFTYIIPVISHFFTIGLAALTQSEAYWRIYPFIFIITEVGLTDAVYNAFKNEKNETGYNFLDKFNFGFNILSNHSIKFFCFFSF
jgi:hypothetical protein